MSESSMFKPAVRENLYLRMALCGSPGAGKTFTGLSTAFLLRDVYKTKVAVIDSEHSSARKYAGETHEGRVWDFDTCELQNFAPSTYTAVLEEAGRCGYGVVLVDSLSHAWTGTGGALEQVDRHKNKFGDGWREVTPQHNAMIEAILKYPGHVIITMRSKIDYVQEKDEKTGKTIVRKIGLRPVQREGMEYEFDVICDIDQETHTLSVAKTRCAAIDGKVISRPTGEFIMPVVRWLGAGKAIEKKDEAKPTFTPSAVNQPSQATTEPTPSSVASSLNGPCTRDQIQEILNQAKKSGADVVRLKALCVERGVQTLSQLTGEQARDVLVALGGIPF